MRKILTCEEGFEEDFEESFEESLMKDSCRHLLPLDIKMHQILMSYSQKSFAYAYDF